MKRNTTQKLENNAKPEQLDRTASFAAESSKAQV